jgi:Acyl-protein synthetase, LuxE
MTAMPAALPAPYALGRSEKASFLLGELTALTDLHRERCPGYARILRKVHLDRSASGSSGLEALPFLPVSIFKAERLSSVPDSAVVKVLVSSGTTGQLPSRVVLDRDTAALQGRALADIIREEIGPARLPMAFVDHPGVVADRGEFSARGAGLLGFATFGRNHEYLLDGTMRPDWTLLRKFEERFAGGPVLLFGFTFMVWRHLVQEARREGIRFSLPHGTLIHGGGWKKLEEERVDAAEFKGAVRERFGIPNVVNYYGMVEQAGSVFVECAEGHLHAPSFAEIIVRDSKTLAPVPHGREGLIQVLSIVPRSYPGHSLLTEDLGVVDGEDTCPTGRLGKYFRVLGRAPRAELRGCSDTHAASWSNRNV